MPHFGARPPRHSVCAVRAPWGAAGGRSTQAVDDHGDSPARVPHWRPPWLHSPARGGLNISSRQVSPPAPGETLCNLGKPSATQALLVLASLQDLAATRWIRFVGGHRTWNLRRQALRSLDPRRNFAGCVVWLRSPRWVRE